MDRWTERIFPSEENISDIINVLALLIQSKTLLYYLLNDTTEIEVS